jgi:hypothetical protein
VLGQRQASGGAQRRRLNTQPRPDSAVLLASSSRSQVAVRTARAAACLTWEAPSVSVRWRPLLSVVIVSLGYPVARESVSRALLRRSSRSACDRSCCSSVTKLTCPWMTALPLPYSPDRARSGHGVLDGRSARPPSMRSAAEPAGVGRTRSMPFNLGSQPRGASGSEFKYRVLRGSFTVSYARGARAGRCTGDRLG